MNPYRKYVLPRLVHTACSVDAVAEERANIVPGASGQILEIGFGSGLNLPFYDPEHVESIWALEPSTEMWELAQENIAASTIPVKHLRARAEEIPLPDESVDTVVVAFTLCTVQDLSLALRQIRRVLKKNGRLLFVEHGAAPERKILRWQRRWEPIWSRVAGGCHLTRSAPDVLESNDFDVIELSSGYIAGWKIDSYIYSGTAVPRRTPANETGEAGGKQKARARTTKSLETA